MLDTLKALPIADILLVLATLMAGTYCVVLSRRLKRFNNLEHGMGGAIAVLSAQIDDLTRMLEQAETSAKSSAQTLQDLTSRSQDGAEKLELLLAALHDLPDPGADPDADRPATFFRSADGSIGMEAAE